MAKIHLGARDRRSVFVELFSDHDLLRNKNIWFANQLQDRWRQTRVVSFDESQWQVATGSQRTHES